MNSKVPNKRPKNIKRPSPPLAPPPIKNISPCPKYCNGWFIDKDGDEVLQKAVDLVLAA